MQEKFLQLSDQAKNLVSAVGLSKNLQPFYQRNVAIFVLTCFTALFVNAIFYPFS